MKNPMKNPILKPAALFLALALALVVVSCSGGGEKPGPDSVAVSGVSLPATLTLTAGTSRTVTADIAPANATNKNVTWGGGDAAVATVSASGLSATVMAVAPGATEITVTTQDGGRTATCAVTVATVHRLTLPKALTVKSSGGRAALAADLWPFGAPDRGVVWESDDTSVATVAAVAGGGTAATVTGLAPGTARITAKSAENPTAADYCDVTVAQSVWRDVFVGGNFGMIKNNEVDRAYDGNVICSIAVDAAGAVHAVGFYDSDEGSDYYLHRPVYFKGGARSRLPLGPGMTEGIAFSVHVTHDDHVYVAGYETDDEGSTFRAKLWLDGADVPLGGVSDYVVTEALSVYASGGRVFVSGVMSVDGYDVDGAILWVDQQPTVYGDQRQWARCVTAAAGDVYMGGAFGLMKLDPRAPQDYRLLPGYERGAGDIGMSVLSVRSVGDDVFAAGYVQADPVLWENHAPKKLTWDTARYDRAEASDAAIGADGSVYVSGHEVEWYWGGDLPHPVLWKDGAKQEIPRFTEEYARAVAVREVPGTAVTGVTLSSGALEIPLGYTMPLVAAIAPANASNQTLAWTSSNPSVAAIVGGGAAVTVSGVGAGEATIRAQSPDGPFAECAVTVGRVSVTGVSLQGDGPLGMGRSLRLHATVTPPDATDQAIQWTSANPGVATVSGGGLMGTVLGVGIGSTAITAVTHDGGHTASRSVSVEPLSSLGDPALYIAGGFGLYVDGWHDGDIGGRPLSDVTVDGGWNVHAAGRRRDPDAPRPWEAAYYRNGELTVLPSTLQGARETGAYGVDVAPGGDAYVVGYEANYSAYALVARLWRVSGGAAASLPLQGMDETGNAYSHALAVRVRDGAVYVAGGAEDSGWNSHPVIWKDQVKHQFAGPFASFMDMAFGPQGTLYALGSDGSIYALSQDLSSMAWVPFGDESANLERIFVDGPDVYAAGFANNYPYYWKNGERRLLETPPGALYTEANDIFVLDGRTYIVGYSYHPGDGVYTQLWIDGVPVHDDRSIHERFYYDADAAPSAVFAKEMARVQVTGVALSDGALDVPVGYSLPLTAVLSPAGATNRYVAWASSDPAVASVSGAGLAVAVDGLALGRATITVTSLDGPSAACEVEVATRSVEGVSLSPEALAVGVGRSARVDASIYPPTATDKGIDWASSDPAVAAVSGDGMVGTVLGVAAGAATITATTRDGLFRAYCQATVSALTDPVVHIAGWFGLYTDGTHNAIIGSQRLEDVTADGPGNVHAVGQHYDASAAPSLRAAHYLNGALSLLPAPHGADNLDTGCYGVWAADGHVYVVGYEHFYGVNPWDVWIARLWTDGELSWLEGVDEDGELESCAYAVRTHGGSVYVAGGADDADGNFVPVIWKDGWRHGMPGHNFEWLRYFWGLAFDAGGTLYALGDYRLFRVAPDLSSMEEVAVPGDAVVEIDRMAVDGADVYLLGYSDYEPAWWRNGERLPLEAPPQGPDGPVWASPIEICALDGHAYIAGVGLYDDGYRTVLWVDGAHAPGGWPPAADYHGAAPRAIFVQR